MHSCGQELETSLAVIQPAMKQKRKGPNLRKGVRQLQNSVSKLTSHANHNSRREEQPEPKLHQHSRSKSFWKRKIKTADENTAPNETQAKLASDVTGQREVECVDSSVVLLKEAQKLINSLKNEVAYWKGQASTSTTPLTSTNKEFLMPSPLLPTSPGDLETPREFSYSPLGDAYNRFSNPVYDTVDGTPIKQTPPPTKDRGLARPSDGNPLFDMQTPTTAPPQVSCHHAETCHESASVTCSTRKGLFISEHHQAATPPQQNQGMPNPEDLPLDECKVASHSSAASSSGEPPAASESDSAESPSSDRNSAEDPTAEQPSGCASSDLSYFTAQSCTAVLKFTTPTRGTSEQYNGGYESCAPTPALSSQVVQLMKSSHWVRQCTDVEKLQSVVLAFQQQAKHQESLATKLADQMSPAPSSFPGSPAMSSYAQLEKELEEMDGAMSMLRQNLEATQEQTELLLDDQQGRQEASTAEQNQTDNEGNPTLNHEATNIDDESCGGLIQDVFRAAGRCHNASLKLRRLVADVPTPESSSQTPSESPAWTPAASPARSVPATELEAPHATPFLADIPQCESPVPRRNSSSIVALTGTAAAYKMQRTSTGSILKISPEAMSSMRAKVPAVSMSWKLADAVQRSEQLVRKNEVLERSELKLRQENFKLSAQLREQEASSQEVQQKLESALEEVQLLQLRVSELQKCLEDGGTGQPVKVTIIANDNTPLKRSLQDYGQEGVMSIMVDSHSPGWSSVGLKPYKRLTVDCSVGSVNSDASNTFRPVTLYCECGKPDCAASGISADDSTNFQGVLPLLSPAAHSEAAGNMTTVDLLDQLLSSVENSPARDTPEHKPRTFQAPEGLCDTHESHGTPELMQEMDNIMSRVGTEDFTFGAKKAANAVAPAANSAGQQTGRVLGDRTNSDLEAQKEVLTGNMSKKQSPGKDTNQRFPDWFKPSPPPARPQATGGDHATGSGSDANMPKENRHTGCRV